MRNRIVSEYSNQLHQLLVSVSKHLYLGGDGQVKYQDKPMDVNLKNVAKSRKEHVVYYILRDHFSGTFTLKITTTKRLIPLADFLYYAWSEEVGEDKFIWGMPETIMIPRTLDIDGLKPGLAGLNIQVIHPTSGFASGVRVIRDIEDNLLFWMGRTVDHTLEGINKLRFKVYRDLIAAPYRDNYYDFWRNCLPAEGHSRIVPPYPDFINLFTEGGTGNSGLVLTKHAQNAVDVEMQKPKRSKKKVSSDFPVFSREKLQQAQDLVYEAWEEPNWQKSLALARKALRISPFCADAYNLLAEKSREPEERQHLYEQGVKFGAMALGDLYFKRYVGHFWIESESRPYMRALAGWSKGLWKNGHKPEAIDNYKELLRLNPNDNQGIRYILVNCLLEEERDVEAARILMEYEAESCFFLYSRALLHFRRGQSVSGDDLQQAWVSNSHVPAFLLRLKPLPFQLPDFYSWGSEGEAVIYTAGARKAWENTPGALDWLSDGIKKLQASQASKREP